MLCAFTAELVIGREIVSKYCDMMLPKDTLDCHFFGQFFVLNFLMRKAEWNWVSISNSSWYVNYKTGNSFDDPSLISAAVAAILQVVELNTNHYDIMKRDFNALHDKCRPISILLVMLQSDSGSIFRTTLLTVLLWCIPRFWPATNIPRECSKQYILDNE